MSVNVPTNQKIKEQDINQKLQLYGIYSAFMNGKAPSNKQVDVALNSALASKPLSRPSPKLSDEGKKLVADLRDVIEKSQHLILTKNDGNLIQDFIYQTTGVTGGDAKRPNAPVDKATAQQHGNELLEGLKTLGQLLVSNGQFRKLLSDASILLRDIGGDAAQNAANKMNPSEEQLAQIDRPAEDNTWHDVPDMSPSTLKQQARDQYQKNKPFNREGAKDAADQAQQQAQADGTATGGATAGAKNLKNQASANIPEEHKQRGREQMDRARNYMGEKMPKERREQTIWRLKKMIVEIQGHQDYQRAIDTILRLAETYQGHTKDVGRQGADSAKDMRQTFKPMLMNLKVLLERFANNTSSDDLFDSINQIYRDADKDPELRGWFKNVDTYIRKCLKEQGFVMQDAATEEWNQLYDKGNFLLRERYRNHTDRLVDEVKFMADQYDKDPQNRAFADSMNRLFMDLGNDENGKPVFKKHLVKDLSEIIVPGIFENIRYVPIPRIEYTDPQVDLIIENLVIEGDNLAPNVFEFGSDNYFRWGRKQIANKNKNKVMLSVSGIQCDIRDVSYYVNKKQGFPSIKDKGVMDIILGGTGFSFKAALETADSTDRQHFFKVNNVTVDVKNFNIKMKKSNYKVLFNLVKPIMLKVMRPALQKILSAQIKQQINNLDGKMYQVQQKVDQMNKDAKRNPEDAPSIYQRYLQSFQEVFKKKEEEAKKKTEDKKTNVAMTQHDSILPNVSLPGGISSKATEYKDLASKGEKWESPVFSIGSAKESTNLPRVGEVTRKPHNVTQATLREHGQTNGSANIGSGAGAASGLGSSATGGSDLGSGVTGGSGLGSTAAGGTNTSNLTNSTHTTLGTHNPVLSGNA